MNDASHIERAIDGAALAPLTKEQKRELVLLARRAWEKGNGNENGNPESRSQKPEAFDEWRHHQTMICCERPGISLCRQEDYSHLKSHLLRLLGQGAMADKMQSRADLEPRRVALWKLQTECKLAADVIQNAHAYVASIARSRFKTSQINDLSEKQLWSLVFDIRRAAQHRRRKVS